MKKLKNVGADSISDQNGNKGITLIALIITIVVMLILVIVSVRIALDTGLFESTGKATKEWGLAQEQEGELGNGKVNIGGTVYNSIDDYIKENHKEEQSYLAITTETEGVIYTDKDGNVKELTEEVETGDIVQYGNYEYKYNGYYSYYRWMGDIEDYWLENSEQNGWGVRCINEEFGEICQLIFEKPVVDISGAFGGTNISAIPKIPSTIETIGYTTFGMCNNLVEITIPDNINTIGRWAFYACENLESVEIPNSVTKIENSAFYYCRSLTDIAIPKSITNIEGHVFQDCTNLKNVIIPESVSNIEECAFQNCTSLTNITYEGTVDQWGDITLESDWARDVATTVVQCSDGTVDI